MSVSVQVYGGFNAAQDLYQVSAVVAGAEYGSAEYDAHNGYQESESMEDAYNYVVAEAGLTGFAPSFEEIKADAIRGFVHRLALVVEVA